MIRFAEVIKYTKWCYNIDMATYTCSKIINIRMFHRTVAMPGKREEKNGMENEGEIPVSITLLIKGKF